jgi:hypothetical protein
MLFQMLFAGVLLNANQIPAPMQWIQYTSLFKYAYEAVSVNNAQGVRLVTSIAGLDVTLTATSILTAFGIDINAYSRDVTIMLAIFIFLLGLIATLVTYRLREKR